VRSARIKPRSAISFLSAVAMANIIVFTVATAPHLENRCFRISDVLQSCLIGPVGALHFWLNPFLAGFAEAPASASAYRVLTAACT